MEDSGNKRSREESEESPEAKRFRADLLFDILEDDSDAGDRDPATQDLVSVMKIFEDEIGLPSPPSLLSAPDAVGPAMLPSDIENLPQPDLGYLLEASDDELGLPPAVPSSSEEGGDSVEAETATDEVEVQAEAVGFGQIWAFDDDITGCYDGLEFGARQQDEKEPAAVAADEAVLFDGGLFDYPDFADLSWRSAYLPAV